MNFNYLKNRYIASEDITQQGIECAVTCDHAHASRILKRNMKNGYIYRQLSKVENKNRKQYIYLLTDEGLRYAQELKDTVQGLEPMFFMDLSKQSKIKEFY